MHLERRRPEGDLVLSERRRQKPSDRFLDSSLDHVNDLADVSQDRLSKGCTIDKIRTDFGRVVSLHRAIAYLAGAAHFPVPGPVTTRPGFAPVCSPSLSTCSPLTNTWRMPTAYC